MKPALIMLVIPRLPSYNGVEVYYLKDCQLSLVFVTGDIIFFFGGGGVGGVGGGDWVKWALVTSSSSAGLIQISEFPEPCSTQ